MDESLIFIKYLCLSQIEFNTKNVTARPVSLENGTQWNQFAEAGRTKPNEHSLLGTDFIFWYLT